MPSNSCIGHCNEGLLVHLCNGLLLQIFGAIGRLLYVEGFYSSSSPLVAASEPHTTGHHHQQAPFCCPTQAWAAAQAFVYADIRQSVRFPVQSSRYCLDLVFPNMFVPLHTTLALRVIMAQISSVLYATLLARLVPKAGSPTSHQSSEPRLLCWPFPGVHKPRLFFACKLGSRKLAFGLSDLTTTGA